MTAPRVLVVDDNPVNIELAVFVLGEEGFVVQGATTAREVERQIAASKPDLVLMDIQMPEVDGLDLTRRLKADPATRHIVVVAFTAYAMKGDEAKMRASGCDGYLSKPIDIETFAASVRTYLQDGTRPLSD